MLIGFIGDPIIQNILTNLLIVVLAFYFFFEMTRFENNNFMKMKSQKEPNILIWAKNLSGEYDLFSYLFETNKISTNILTNLQEIETRILQITGGRLRKLRHLRAYLKTLSQQKFEKVYYKAVVAVIIGFLAPAINNYRSNEELVSYKILTNPELSWGLYITILIFVIYYMVIPHKHDNQRNLAINILDGIIDEMERIKSD